LISEEKNKCLTLLNCEFTQNKYLTLLLNHSWANTSDNIGEVSAQGIWVPTIVVEKGKVEIVLHSLGNICTIQALDAVVLPVDTSQQGA